MIVAEVSMVPVGKGTSISKYVKKFADQLLKHNITVVFGPLSTAFECKDVPTAFSIIQEAHEAVFKGTDAKRVILTIKVDDRRDKDSGIKHKLKYFQEEAE